MNVSAWLPACSALGSLWLASLWQGIALAAVTALLLHWMPRLVPSVRYRIWAAAYAACVLLPILECVRTIQNSMAGSVLGSMARAFTSASAPLVILDSRWTLLLAALWIAASLFFAMRFGAGLWSIRQLLRSSVPLQAGEMSRYAALLQLRSRGRVIVLLSDRIDAPVATGYFQPLIVLPRTLLADLNREQTEQVLRHELEHLARRDDWAMLGMAWVRCIVPLHPALAWLERQMVATREMACDDAVLRSTTPRAYASNLAQIAECSVRRRLLVTPNLLGMRSQLAHRMEHILSGRRTGEGMARGVLCAAIAGMLVLSALLVRCPALVTFQSRSTKTTVQASFREPVSPAPKIVLAAAHPRVHRVAARVRSNHRHTVAATPRLLATSHPSRTPIRVVNVAPAQPTTVLVFWNDRQHGFVTLIFDFSSGADGANASRRNILSLEI